MFNHHRHIPATVRAFLRAKRVLIIGGDRRPAQLERLQVAFPGAEFVWVPTRKSNASLKSFDYLINRPDISLVVILYRLARTGHSKGARRLCSKLHKPLLWCGRPTPSAIARALLPYLN